MQRITQFVHTIWQKKGLLSTLLYPLAWCAKVYSDRKRKRYQAQPSLAYYSHTPVIVVGNIIVGGAGKTPVVLALIHALRQHGYTPGVISRGYGARLGKYPHTSDVSLDAKYLGDEPALLAQTAHVPVSVHPQRTAALQYLNQRFPNVDVVISDDGLQHRQLGRVAEIIVQDQRGNGNGRLLPAGPLRESIAAYDQATLIVKQIAPPNPSALSTGERLDKMVLMHLWPVRFRRLHDQFCVPAADALRHFHKHRIAAVAAIGQPQRFFFMLNAFGFTLQKTLPLADHYDYSSNPFTEINADIILITPKDAVKCHKFMDQRLWEVDVTTHFSEKNWYYPVLQTLRAQNPARDLCQK